MYIIKCLVFVGFSVFCLTFAIRAQELVAHQDYAKEASIGSQDLRKASVCTDTVYYEDFSNGLTDWTIVNTEPSFFQTWEYELNPDLSADNVDDRFPIFTSPSVDDGFLWFDYIHVLRMMGAGNTIRQLIGSAESPFLDWSMIDPDENYELSFYSYQPTLNITNCRVEIRRRGIADATVWSSFDVIDRPNVARQGVVIGSIPDRFIGQDSVQIVFIHDGDYYGWAVDDILVSGRAGIDIQLDNFFANAPNFITPSSQADGYEMAFLAGVGNNGCETVDIDLAISLFDEINALIYTDTLQYTGVAPDSFIRNLPFNNTFPLPTAEGEYTGIYEVFTERISEDPNPSDNSRTFNFTVGEDLFSKGPFTSGTRPAGDDQAYAFANIYYTPSLPATSDSVLQIKEITFGMFPENFTDDDEALIDLSTYAFRGDLNGDDNAQFGDISDPDAELIELATRKFVIDTSFSEIPNGTPITYAPSEDGGVTLSADQDFVGFVVQVSYAPGVGGTNADNVCFLGNTPQTYGIFNFAAAEAGISDSLSSMLSFNDETYYAFFAGSSPYIDATISYDVNSSVKELTPLEFAVRPNPATTQFAIDFNFGTAVDAQFDIINAVGQTVSTFNRDGLTTGAITIPTQGMNNGLYYVKVRTNDGKVASRKLLLAR